jgi:hypothetical protein
VKLAVVSGYLFSDPFRHVKVLVFKFQLNLSHHHPLVVAEKLIDFPAKAALIDRASHLFNQRHLAKIAEKLVRLSHQNLIFEFKLGKVQCLVH